MGRNRLKNNPMPTGCGKNQGSSATEKIYRLSTAHACKLTLAKFPGRKGKSTRLTDRYKQLKAPANYSNLATASLECYFVDCRV